MTLVTAAESCCTADGYVPVLLTGSYGLWAASCLVPGCLWTFTSSAAEVADREALHHNANAHGEGVTW